MNIFTAVKYCCILHGHVFVIEYKSRRITLDCLIEPTRIDDICICSMILHKFMSIFIKDVIVINALLKFATIYLKIP